MIDQYKQIEHILGSKLVKSIPEIILVTKKWSNSDYIYPFSDIDYRLIVTDGADLYKLNERLYNVHFKCVNEISYGTRIFEHPPGFLYFESELKGLLIDSDNFCKDSFSSGDRKLFEETIMHIDSSINNPMQLYVSFMLRYNNFSLKYEYNAYEAEVKEKYEKYCVIWHYYLPCVYFLQGLKDNCIYNNKINDKWYSDGFMKLISDFRNYKEPSSSLIELVNMVDEELKRIVNLNDSLLPNKKSIKSNDMLFMLRTRIARILYYLNPPANCDTLYLQERECKELQNLFVFFDKHDKYLLWNKLLYILDSKRSSTTSKLQQILKEFYTEKIYLSEIMLGEKFLR